MGGRSANTPSRYRSPRAPSLPGKEPSTLTQLYPKRPSLPQGEPGERTCTASLRDRAVLAEAEPSFRKRKLRLTPLPGAEVDSWRCYWLWRRDYVPLVTGFCVGSFQKVNARF